MFSPTAIGRMRAGTSTLNEGVVLYNTYIYVFFLFFLTKQASPSLLEVTVFYGSKPLVTMASSIYTYILIHIHTYNRHAYLYSQSYKLSYILLNF